MELKWKMFLFKTIFWIMGEVLLNVLGLDNVADYTEFIFGQEMELSKKNNRMVKLSCLKPKFCPKINENCPVNEVAFQFSEAPIDDCISHHSVFFNKCVKVKHHCIKASLFSDLSYSSHGKESQDDS